MRRLLSTSALSIALCLSSAASAQEAAGAAKDNPFGQLEAASRLASSRGLEGVRDEIKTALASPVRDARAYLRVAELMKRVGDWRAEDYYEKAIEADEEEPAYELFYADYLRNFRGAGRPLFPAAEKRYRRALAKLRRAGEGRAWDGETLRRVERGLVALHQEDGLPLLSSRRGDTDPAGRPDTPSLFFSSVDRYAQLAGDFDNADDVRAFTSEAMLVSSRLNADLSEGQLRGVLRRKGQFETLNRLRFRHGAWPVVDVSYKYRKVARGQLTNFFEPGKSNDIDLDEYGVSVEKPFDVSPYFDLFVRGGYKRVVRRGLLEFFPAEKERIEQYEARASLARFVGPDKALLDVVYVFQDIDQPVFDFSKRDRRIVAATFTYQLLRHSLDAAYRRRFETRGAHLFAGAADDRESFGPVKLVRNDYFAGASLKGLGAYEVTVQPTVFTSRVEGDRAPRRNAQYRTNLNLLWRIKDEEAEPGLPAEARSLNTAFVHLSVPVRHDVAIRGLKDFENFNVGLALHAKFFTTGARRTTFLASFGYNFQRFYRLDKNLNLLSVGVGLGF
jgi:hypothetical protein